MRNQDNERPRYAHIQYDLLHKLQVSFAEYALLDMVYHLSAKHGYCYKSVYSIAKDMRLSFNGAKYMIGRLIERELLVEHNHGLVVGQSFLEIANTQKNDETIETAKSAVNSAKSAVQKRNRGEVLQKVQTSAKSSVKNNSKINTLRQKRNDARVIIDYWNKTFSQNIKHLDDRITKIVKRMDNFTPEQICIAIKHASLEPFFNGESAGGWKGDLDYLVRSDKNTEKYLNLKPKQRSTYA